MITKANAVIAKLPTNYGTNASDLKKDKIADIWREGKSTLFRAYKMVYRKITKKSIGVQKASTWDCLEDICCCPLTHDAVSWAIFMEYLQKGTDAKKLTKRKLGAILYAYLWAQRIGWRGARRDGLTHTV